MSDNPLHNYRSYSYHQILIACNTTAVATYISSLSGEQTYEQILTQKGPGGRTSYQQQSDSDGILVNSIPNKGEYCLVINGMSDAEFYIADCEWETWITPSYQSGQEQQLSTVSTDGMFSVVEPRGFRFFNIIENVLRALGSGSTGTTWLLKTVFVGHTDASSAPTYISNVKPIQLMITNITARFDESGAKYNIEFVGQANGIAKMPAMSQIDVNHFSVQSGLSLTAAMESFEQLLNTNYREKHQDRDLTESQRTIQYRITLDENYSDAKYVLDKLTSEQAGSSDDSGTISFTPRSTVEQKLFELMMYFSEVMKEGESTPKRIFKIYSNVESDMDTVYLDYHIRPLMVPEVMDSGGLELVPGLEYQTLEFDYIYTGKNVDIVKFDINMNTAFMFFHNLERVDPVTHDQSNVNTVDKATPAESKGNVRHRLPGAPLLPITSKPTKYRVKDPLSTDSFIDALNKYASVETLENSVEIHGNPLLLNSMNTQPGEFRNSSTTNESISNWYTVPSLCKINVSMPSNTSNVGTYPGGEYQVPFWYQGYYTILFVKHNFKAGRFTQTLNMKNVPMVGDDSIVSPDYQDRQTPIQQGSIDD